MQFLALSTSSEEEFARTLYGMDLWVQSALPRQFDASYRWLDLGPFNVHTFEFGSPIVIVAQERYVPSLACGVIDTPGLLNGVEFKQGDVSLVRQGLPFTLRTPAASRLHCFCLQPALYDEAPELDLPFHPGLVPDNGRWRHAAARANQRFVRLMDRIMPIVAGKPELRTIPEVNVSIRNVLLSAILGMGEDGELVIDRAAVRRHTRVMMRLQTALQEAEFRPVDVALLCRRIGVSRRSLEAIVHEHTGRSLGGYTRLCRLTKAHQLLRMPPAGATVTSVAMSLGFWHLSRFAQSYQQMFGEPPSMTLRKALGRFDLAA